MSKPLFIDSPHCRMRAHCNACRNKPAWRAKMSETFVIPNRCWRVTGLGDVVAAVLKLPGIAWVVKALTGIDPYKPCGGCKKRQQWLNDKVPLRARL